MSAMTSTLRTLAGRAERILTWLELTIIGGTLALCALLLFANVVLRYVFLAPLGWAEEVSIYAMVWIVFIGASAVLRAGGHIAVDLLPLALSPPQRRLLQALALTLALCFFAVFCYYSLQHTLRTRALGQVTPALLAPMWLAYLALPVGSFLMTIRTLQLLWHVALHPPQQTHRAPMLRD
jgi:C4-dicarboxylate transporter, DctQ subunit